MSYLSDEQRLFFETNGYLMVEGALAPAELERVRAAADDAEARWRRMPELPGVRGPHFFQIEAVMEYHPVLFDLVEQPRLFPIVWEVLGPDVQLLDHAYYITPPGALVRGTAWHSDIGHRVGGVYHPRSTMMVRVMYALEDVGPDGGATLVLPGSHRYTADVRIPAVEVPEDLPGAVRLTCKAGTAYLYNGNLWHAPGNNRSAVTRRMLLFNYGHRWMRMWSGHEPSEWLAERATTPMRRQLLGLNRAYYGPDAPLEIQ